MLTRIAIKPQPGVRPSAERSAPCPHCQAAAEANCDSLGRAVLDCASCGRRTLIPRVMTPPREQPITPRAIARSRQAEARRNAAQRYVFVSATGEMLIASERELAERVGCSYKTANWLARGITHVTKDGWRCRGLVLAVSGGRDE